MTLGFATAADFLGGTVAQVEKKDEHNDPILRDLRVMKDTETKHNAPPPLRYDQKGVTSGFNPRSLNSKLQQPKPKFVAHKEPKGRKNKGKTSSDRLGGNHMA